ncbi:MAG: Lipid biosynthesis lauroyl acyltransferase [Pseudomonadota bacterium]|jgi:KDO2-lipid IV(A) lauroyltransferase
MIASPAFSAQLLHPRYWPIWLGFGLWWLMAQLPYAWQMAMGAQLGRVLGRLAPRRRAIAARNIELCFPHLNPLEQHQLVDGVMDSIGKAFFETGIAWFMPSRRLRKLLTLHGIEHLHQAKARGQGVVLVAMHFTHLEMGAAAVSMQSPIDGLYRPHANALYDYLQRICRERHNTGGCILRGDVRGMVRALKEAHGVWYAPDQDYGRDHSVFVPFFGVSSATITATSQLAKMGGAQVIPFAHHRRSDGKGYNVEILPPITELLQGDDHQNAHVINQLIEREISKHPEQYLWVHRRFKTRPPGEADIYQAAGIGRGRRG